ncbi:hypothetical protein C4K68_06405 [Pokkaliibacter plantistimulans]|uniref:Uncharacterized protein n=1 Tax=Proteobacteria bacterium 228 TaxID=2083153 RepID=A0A2S5KTS7_9PROT|nr:hypothetical protein [Pokkaliibacter plantistimulans]PPC78261.1 hypothetical protein C4K68_06405 [Pokkaliibacter plantistimulans]
MHSARRPLLPLLHRLRAHWRKLGGAVLATLLFSPGSQAAGIDPAAEFFATLYLNTCMRYVGDAQTLRNQLLQQKLPALSKDEAAFFLENQKGEAWSVPSSVGNFVLAIRRDGICAVFAERANTATTEALFSSLMVKTPNGLQALKVRDTARQGNLGTVRTMEYRWFAAGNNKALQFILTTLPAGDAKVQAMATSSTVNSGVR